MHVIAKCKMVFGYFHNCCQKWIISLQYYHKSPPPHPPSPIIHLQYIIVLTCRAG